MYELYFLPTRVVEEYKNTIKDLTVAIIKRKLSAMIYATMHDREKVNNYLYKHNCGKFDIWVENNRRVIQKISYTGDKSNNVNFKIYNEACISFGLNDSKDRFSLIDTENKRGL